MSAAPVAVEAISQPHATESPRFLPRLLKRKLAVVCLAYIAVVVLIGIIAPHVMPGVASERAGDLAHTLQGPTWHHLLGTDSLGRDVLDRLLVGTWPGVVGVSEALLVVLVVGVSLGLAAGYAGGLLDRAVSWVADLAFALPGLIIILVVLTVFPGSTLAGMVTLGVLASPGMMRIVRSAVLPVKEELYIAAARVSGLSRPYIITRHVLPRVSGAVIVQSSLLAGSALLAQSGLAFLGLFVRPPAPSWGGTLADGIHAIFQQPWLIWPPGITIAVTILALGLLGDAVRDTTAETWSAPVRTRRRLAPVTGPQPTEHAAPVHSATLLSVDGLSVAFMAPDGRSTRVVENVSFDIRRGEAVGVVGESGCGKTATSMAILGLLQGTGHIESGRVLFDGVDLASLSERELRAIRGKRIGLISQDPAASLDPAFRVGTQLVEVVRRHHELGRKAARLRALELLRQVHLPDPESVARRFPHQLSGGMAQRVAIAAALAGEPSLLIADEPTTALDVTLQAEILALLRELLRDRGMALLLVTHDWGVVADICDRAVVMYAGQVVERAELVQMFEQPLHPYTEALLAANPHNSPEAEWLQAIPGTVPQPGEWPDGCHFNPRCRYVTAACRSGAIPLVNAQPDRETRCIHSGELILQ
jgi:peptide/nickel transport system permease protein